MICVETASGSIPKLGVGTWQLTGEACSSLVSQALDVGYRHIDTAVMYGNEEAVGEGLKTASVDRDDVFVTTKVWFDQIGEGDLQRSAESSLKRLNLDYVDLLLIHWPNPEIPLTESIRALCDAKSSGLARGIGVSNFPSALLDLALELAAEPLICNQVEYHPFLTQKTLLAACRKNNMAMTAYAPIAKGTVADDPVIREIANDHDVTPAQIAIAWLYGQENVVAIPKTASRERLIENMAASEISLSPSEMDRISALGSPSGRMVNAGFAPQWDDE